MKNEVSLFETDLVFGNQQLLLNVLQPKPKLFSLFDLR